LRGEVEGGSLLHLFGLDACRCLLWKTVKHPGVVDPFYPFANC